MVDLCISTAGAWIPLATLARPMNSNGRPVHPIRNLQESSADLRISTADTWIPLEILARGVHFNDRQAPRSTLGSAYRKSYLAAISYRLPGAIWEVLIIHYNA